MRRNHRHFRPEVQVVRDGAANRGFVAHWKALTFGLFGLSLPSAAKFRDNRCLLQVCPDVCLVIPLW